MIGALLMVAAGVRGPAQPAMFAAPSTTLRVTSYADDGREGTLRWAIEQHNAHPERDRIEIERMGHAPYVIEPLRPLPPIMGPVQIEGIAWRERGELIVLDGSAYIQDQGVATCPGATPGQYGANVRTLTLPGLHLVDTRSVEISGLEIRDFCIGILIQRASENLIHDNRIAANRGGAGVMLTGDDGQGNPTDTTTLHNKILRNEFLDNGDGLELTRGAAFNLVADNVFRSTNANPEPSQGIEILRGNDNVIIRNRFEGYSDGLQINFGNRNYIAANEFTHNTFGLSLTGDANIIDANLIHDNGVGIAVRPGRTATIARLMRNSIHANAQPIRRCHAGGSCDPKIRKGAIVLGLPGLEDPDFVGSRGGGAIPPPSMQERISPNRGISPPQIDRVRGKGRDLLIEGRVNAGPGQHYTIEVFGNRDANSSEAETFLGATRTQTDATGHATFALSVSTSTLGVRPRSFTATITSPDGATSELGPATRIAP